MRNRLAGAIAALLFGLTGAGLAADRCAPADIGDGWTIADAAQHGFDADALCSAITRGVDPTSNTHAIVVERGGRLIAESYFSGDDRPTGSVSARPTSFQPTTLHDLQSISKSVVSLLVGIALAERRITSLDTPVLDYFPEYADLRTPERASITLQHLLTMTAGFEWDESGSYARPGNDASRMRFAADRFRFVLGREIVAAPGSRFVYNSGATTLLGEVLERTTGMPIAEYASQKLFKPLGIVDVAWRKFADGKAAAAGGLRMRPRDLAKIGRLLLAGGRWQGVQLVPTDWVATALRGQVAVSDRIRYGYQFWSGNVRHGGASLPWRAGFGNGGQRLFMVPALDLVVVVMTGRYNEANAGRASYEAFQRIVSAVAAP